MLSFILANSLNHLSCNLIFTKSGYNSTNTQVGMGMENYQSQLSTAFVSGNVDFR